MKYSNPESEYLILLLRSAMLQKSLPSLPKGIDLDRLVELSKKQQVYSIIASLPCDEIFSGSQLTEIKNYAGNELLRLLSMKNELEQLKGELEHQGIKYMLLKGSVIRDYYPQQKMRQMSDIDILYDESKRDALLKIMRSRGFRLTTSCENSDDFFKEPFYTFEFHRELFFKEAEFCPHFDLWSNARQDDSNPCMYHIDDTENFVYTVCHMYKHYATHGCGVRFLCDIFALQNSNCTVDMEKAFSRFDEIGINAFAADAISLANAVFNDGQITDNQQKMLDFLLSSGVYGNNVVDYSKLLSQYGNSKIKYLFRRIFPEIKKMKAYYRQLEKRPYLLPIYYIIRLFEKIKYNSKSAKAELKEIRKTHR